MSGGFGKEDFYQYTNESSGIRLPQSQPKVLTAIGRGRGRGKAREDPYDYEEAQPQYQQFPISDQASAQSQTSPEPAQPKQSNMAFQYALAARTEGLRRHDTDPLATAVRQAQMPFKEHRDAQREAEMRRANQKYIPGLTPRPVELEPPPGLVEKGNTPKKVPPELIKAFLNGAKHPVSAIMEYSSMVRAETSFREVCVERPSYKAKFANVCTVNGVSYPQGTGPTKKDAKTEAAKLAFTAILGIEDDDVDEGECDTMIYDSFGRCVQLDSKTPISGPLPPPVTAQNLATLPMEMLANPVSKLSEFCQKIRLPYILTVNDGWDENKRPQYTAAVIIREKPIASGIGKSKKDAKKLACSQALVILQTGQIQFGDDEEVTLHDSIASMCHKTHIKLLKKCPNHFWGGKIMAAFVLKLSDKDGGHVVSLGTGCSSLFAGKLAADGRSLIDGHAEVVARRGLLRYFHRKIKEYYESPPACKSASMFNQKPGSFKLVMKPNISIHLYITDAPYGDASAFLDEPSAPLDENQEELVEGGAHFPNFTEGEEFMGLLSLKSENEQMASPVCMSDIPSQTVESIQAGQPITVMSTSDKVLSWNILGLQGALIGCFLEPVYLSTITIGQNFDHGHQARAFCCRVDDKINHLLPAGFRLNHPRLDTINNYDDSWKCPIVNTVSVNWMYGDADNQIEVVDTCTGKSVETSPFRTSATGASRISKAGFLFRFRELAKAAKVRPLYDAKTYAEAKKMNEPYQQAKKVFHQHLSDANFGTWFRKPYQMQMFAK